MSLLQATLREFVSTVLDTPLPQLAGLPLGAVFPRGDRTPARLRALRPLVHRDASQLAFLAPTVAFAVVGQAKLDGAINAWTESAIVSRLLRYWALQSSIDASIACAGRPAAAAAATLVPAAA